MKKTKFKMTGNGSGTEKSFESSCFCASVLKKDAGVVEGDFNTETQRLRGTEFKMTEIGLIPEDWEVKRIGDMGQVVTGSTPPRNNSANWGGDFNWISAKDFNGKYISKTEEHITEAGKRFCRLLPENSVLVTCIASIGLNAISKKACATNQQINAVVCRVDSPEYLYYQICYRNGDLKLLAGQTAVPIIGKKQFEDVLISVPPLPEQKAIAKALSDVDELLAAMRTLIEKKRAIKQGAMQELLGMRNGECGMRNVPRRRLAGFSGEWVEKRLGEIASFETTTIDVAKIDSERYVGTENMISEKAGIEKNQTPIPYRMVREYKVGDVLISNIRPYLKKIWLADRDGGCSSDVLVVRTLDSSVCLPTFLKMLLSDDLFFDFVMANAVGTKMPRGDKKVIVNYEVCLPTLAEQEAIAEVLSDMDAEIEALEAKRAKYESIKQGMMQELLTGKTRLKG